MLLLTLELRHVRNLAPLVLEPGPRFNVFSGDNGQGKTNLLETVYVVGALRSFRTQRLAELIAFGADSAYVAARVHARGLERAYELTLRERSRKVRLDGKTVRPISKYFGSFNVVLFAPEDLWVPRGSPSDRRRFLDRAAFHADTDHLGAAQAYEKALKNRNALLRDIAEGARSKRESMVLLDVLDEQLAELGAALVCSRRSFLADLAPRLAAAYESITQSGLSAALRYEFSAGPDVPPDPSPTREALTAGLAERRPRDLARGATSVGPHRDDLVFEVDGRRASAFASQGQLRALVLAWKTAELALLGERRGEPPLLLLDDVSSELDPTRNEYLFSFLRQSASQCFITTTHPDHVLLPSERVDYQVVAGAVTRRKEC